MPFGDDFPYQPWFQWGRSEVVIIYPYIYIDAFNDTISSGRRFMLSVPISVSKKNLAFWDVQRVPFPVRQGQAVPCPPAWTSSPRPSGSPAHTSPRNKNQGEDYCELMCVQCTGRYVYIYEYMYTHNINLCIHYIHIYLVGVLVVYTVLYTLNYVYLYYR